MSAMSNTGAYPLDPDSPAGGVRLLVGDTDPTPIPPEAPATESTTGTYLWYSDAELEALVTRFRGNIPRTAAHVITAIARSQALLLKKWTSADLAVDGPAITRALLQSAGSLEDEAKRVDLIGDAEGGLALVPTGGISVTALVLAEPAMTTEQADRYLAPWMV